MEQSRKVKGFVAGKVIAVILIIIFCAAASSCSRERGRNGQKAGPAAQSGDVAPDFTLKDLQGRDVKLSEYRGKVVLLEFWATWCPPCRATVPELVALQEKYKSRDFAVLGVSLDDEGQNLQSDLSEFAKEFHVNYRVLVGSEAVEHDYKIWSIPRSFLIDKDGIIRDSYSGYVDQYESKVSAQIERLL